MKSLQSGSGKSSSIKTHLSRQRKTPQTCGVMLEVFDALSVRTELDLWHDHGVWSLHRACHIVLPHTLIYQLPAQSLTKANVLELTQYFIANRLKSISPEQIETLNHDSRMDRCVHPDAPTDDVDNTEDTRTFRKILMDRIETIETTTCLDAMHIDIDNYPKWRISSYL